MVASHANRLQLRRNASRLTSIPHVWISDTVLQRAWQSFICSTYVHKKQTTRPCSSAVAHTPVNGPSQIVPPSQLQLAASFRLSQAQRSSNILSSHQLRHGSSVPGPLEARKRRSFRKRMTDLASFDLGTGGLDPGALMGINPKEQRNFEKDDSAGSSITLEGVEVDLGTCKFRFPARIRRFIFSSGRPWSLWDSWRLPPMPPSPTIGVIESTEEGDNMNLVRERLKRRVLAQVRYPITKSFISSLMHSRSFP